MVHGSPLLDACGEKGSDGDDGSWEKVGERYVRGRRGGPEAPKAKGQPITLALEASYIRMEKVSKCIDF